MNEPKAVLRTVAHYLDNSWRGEQTNEQIDGDQTDDSVYSYEDYCGKCLERLPDGFYFHLGHRFCPWCGVRLEETSETEGIRQGEGPWKIHALEARWIKRERDRNAQALAKESAKQADITPSAQAYVPQSLDELLEWITSHQDQDVKVFCGARGPSNPTDPYGLHVSISWAWTGKLRRLQEPRALVGVAEGGYLTLNQPVSKQITFSDNETGKESEIPTIETPLDLIRAIDLIEVGEHKSINRPNN